MLVLLVAVFAMWRAFAYDTAPVSDPKALGFSSSRLARIAAWQQTQVDAGVFSGAVAAIARNGKVAYLQAVGFRDRAKTIPLQSRCHLLDRLDDQAGHQRGRHDAGRGGQARSCCSGLAVSSRVQGT